MVVVGAVVHNIFNDIIIAKMARNMRDKIKLATDWNEVTAKEEGKKHSAFEVIIHWPCYAKLLNKLVNGRRRRSKLPSLCVFFSHFNSICALPASTITSLLWGLLVQRRVPNDAGGQAGKGDDSDGHDVSRINQWIETPLRSQHTHNDDVAVCCVAMVGGVSHRPSADALRMMGT